MSSNGSGVDPHAPCAVPTGRNGELRVQLVADPVSGLLTRASLRLFRVYVTPDGRALSPTSAGFNIPATALRPLASALRELAERLEHSGLGPDGAA